MDKEQVRETIEQLVESQYDRLQAQTRLRKFQDARTPPLAPSKFESLEAFLDFYGRTQDQEDSLESLNTEYTNATEQYDQARAALSRALPTNVPLYYTYEGGREELIDQQYEIVNMSSPGEGQIRITHGAAQS
jgi:DNA-binding transcriptional MocR family regulator